MIIDNPSINLPVDPERFCEPFVDQPIKLEIWRSEVDEYLKSIGMLSVGGCVATGEFEWLEGGVVKPRANAKKKSFKALADLGNYEEEVEEPQPTLPTFAELEEIFNNAVLSGDFNDFVSNIWIIHKFDDTLVGYTDVERFPRLNQIEKGVTDSHARDIFSFWHNFFDKKGYEARFAVEEPEAEQRIQIMKNGLVHPDFVAVARHEYLNRVKARLLAEAEDRNCIFDKTLFREHRNAVLDADPEDVETLVKVFYIENDYSLNREPKNAKFKEKNVVKKHPVVKDKEAIEKLFLKDEGGGAGVKKKPSVRRVFLSDNQKRLAELTAVYDGNSRFYDGYDDEPVEIKPRRVESSKPIRDTAQNEPRNGNGHAMTGRKPAEAQPVFAGHRPNILVMARGMRRTVTYL